jgi:hypothetical protein
MIGDTTSNAILNKIQTSGMSRATAGNLSYAGVEASRKFAQVDLDRALVLKDKFENIGNALGIPPALLAAIASRESRCGKVLDKNGYGDSGHAFGIMQIDSRANTILGKDDPASSVHVDQAAHLVKSSLWKVAHDHPNWPAASQLRGAVAAYNCGAGNIRTIEHMDDGTTGNDYSSDVWERARFYAGL